MGKAGSRALVPAPAAGPGGGGPLAQVALGLSSANTKRAYLRDWEDFFGKDPARVTAKEILSVRMPMVARFRDRLVKEKKGPGTIARKLTALRTLYDKLLRMKMVPFNPADAKLVQAPRRGDVQKMDSLDEAEIHSFLGGIDRSSPVGRRDYAVILLNLHMGLRRSEVLAIRTEQFKTEDDRAYVVFRSKREKERIVWVNRDVEAALRDYAADRGRDDGWLFPGYRGGHLSGDQFHIIVQGHLEKAGIKKKIGTHGLRATFITINIKKGTPLSEIQKTVGHSRAETTLGYARDLEMKKSMAPKAMEGLNGNPKNEENGDDVPE